MQALIDALVLEDSALAEYSCSPEEQIPMTLQVALVGTDGLVIATDKKANFADDPIRTSSTTGKIVWNSETGILCAASGDWLAPHIARDIVRMNIPETACVDDIFGTLQTLTEELWERHVPKKRDGRPERDPNVCFLIAMMKPPYHLWRIAHPKRTSGTSPYIDKIHAGDDRNAAKYLTERFYRHPNLLPVRNLVFLAAHVILEGAKLNPVGVGGLDIVWWKFGDIEPKIFSEDEKAEIIRRSDELSEATRNKLLIEL